MLSADPFVQAPANPQNFNRYTYALNNPLAYTDPSGFFFKKALKWVGRILSPAVAVVNKVFGPQVASIFSAIGSMFCGPYAPACAAAGQFQIGIENGASIGQSLKGAAIAAAGNYIAGGGLDVGNAYANVVVAGVAQGGLAVASGGKFAGAFASSVFSAGAGAVIPGSGNFGVEVLRRAVIGGTASVIGGGKFANGAATAAFEYAALSTVRGVGSAASRVRQSSGSANRAAHALPDFVDDPVVRDEIYDAWLDSNPYAPELLGGRSGSLKREQGGWILRDNLTGVRRVVRVSPGLRDRLNLGHRPHVPGNTHSIEAFFHTHPNTISEGYDYLPSYADRSDNVAKYFKVPHVVKSHQGIHLVTPLP